jgi:multiple sugar transport system ATP-binding protein
MASVEINAVWKYYGKTAAVKDLNINVADGEFLCVLGPSGCGKSSTLRMLAGLEHISAGTISFAGQRVNELPPKDRDIAMVFENYALYPHKTVFENMANPLRLRNVDATTIKQKVERAAEMLEIGHLLERKPQELSGGQKQRTAIGRAIVREPKLFLFDEPIAHLDAKLRAHMRGELKLLQRRLSTTMVYVTHDQLEAMSMADRIAVMNNGVLQQLGTPQDVYNNPANEWVAGFVGEPPMNFMDGELAEQSDGTWFTHPNFKIKLKGEQVAQVKRGNAGRAARMGVRPDQVAISLQGVPGAIPSDILVTEPLGGDMLVDIRVGESKLLVKTKPDFSGQMGGRCFAHVDHGRWHLFSRENGIAYF